MMSHKKSRSQSFLLGDFDLPSASECISEPKRQRLRHLLIGSREVVTKTIHYLHLIGYASEGDWSPLQPNPDNPLEVISVLVRYIVV